MNKVVPAPAKLWRTSRTVSAWLSGDSVSAAFPMCSSPPGGSREPRDGQPSCRAVQDEPSSTCGISHASLVIMDASASVAPVTCSSPPAHGGWAPRPPRPAAGTGRGCTYTCDDETDGCPSRLDHIDTRPGVRILLPQACRSWCVACGWPNRPGGRPLPAAFRSRPAHRSPSG
jgi:hypothetical protein